MLTVPLRQPSSSNVRRDPESSSILFMPNPALTEIYCSFEFDFHLQVCYSERLSQCTIHLMAESGPVRYWSEGSSPSNSQS